MHYPDSRSVESILHWYERDPPSVPQSIAVRGHVNPQSIAVRGHVNKNNFSLYGSWEALDGCKILICSIGLRA